MSNVRGRPVQESLKIRHYVMNLIYTHPGEAVMLPSSVELSRMFGVARSTVTLVLQALTREGYIEGKRGIGTFTKCNGTFFPDRRKAPLVGLLYGDGKFFFYEYSAWSLLSCTGRSLTRSLRMVRHLSLVSMSDDEMFNEIRSQYLDALVWFNASETRLPLIRRLEEAGILIVTCGELPEEAAVDSDCSPRGAAGSSSPSKTTPAGAACAVLKMHTAKPAESLICMRSGRSPRPPSSTRSQRSSKPG